METVSTLPTTFRRALWMCEMDPDRKFAIS